MAELILSLGKCEDLTGREYNSVTFLSFVGKTTNCQTRWRCRCDCGAEFESYAASVVHGRTKSCGCLKRAHLISMTTTHGGCNTQEHEAWRNMIGRCERKSSREYHNYGARGIKVCERWRHSFPNFLADVGPKPSPKHSLDRYPNNDGDYEPGNVRWATWQEQSRNKRSNQFLTCRGITLTVTDWATRLGVSTGGIRARVRKGWSDEEILTTPFAPRRKRKAI